MWKLVVRGAWPKRVALPLLVAAGALALAAFPSSATSVSQAKKPPSAVVVKGTVRATPNRRVRVPVRCARARSACTGTLVLRIADGGKRLDGSSFRVKAGKTKSVRMRLTPDDFAWLRAQQSARVRAVASTNRAGKKPVRRARVLNLQAPSTGGGAIDTSGDQALADRAALRPSDLPDGWSRADTGNTGLSQCFEERLDGSDPAITGLHDHEAFEAGLTQGAGSFVVVLDSVDAASSVLNQTAAVVNHCLWTAVSGSTVDGAKIGNVTVAKIGFRSLGDRSVAYRATLPTTVAIFDLDVLIDFVYVRRGRAIVMLYFADANAPFDRSLAESIAARVVARMGS